MTPDLLQQLITAAEQGQPELPAELLNFAGGRSAPKVRRLLNALCSQLGANYLEVGVYTGSTFIPAVYGNQATATCIDHWEMFQGSYEQFMKNKRSFLDGRKVNIINHDCFTLDVSIVPQGINVYFYDGDHSARAQYDAIAHYAPCLASPCVILVDDANWEEPREETRRAIRDLGWRVLFERLLPGDYNGSAAGWWNGLLVELIER